MNLTKILPVTALGFGKPFQIPTIDELFQESLNLEMYCGTFISNSNEIILSISIINNSLYAKFGNNPPFEIYPKGNHQFFGKKIEVEFRFGIINDLITGLSVEKMGHIFHFKKDTK